MSFLALVSAEAQELQSSLTSEQIAARRNLELAKRDLRFYLDVEYPRQQRHLSQLMELTRQEISDLQWRLRQYQPFSRFSINDPFMTTIQNTQMCLREAEFRLRNLIAEKVTLNRYHIDIWRDLELRVQQARLQVLELETLEEPVLSRVADRPAI